MKIPVKIGSFAAALSLAFSMFTTPCAGEGPKSVTSGGGGRPEVLVVDEPQEALKLWQKRGLRDKALLVISADLGIMPIEEDELARIYGLAAKSGWGGQLSKSYPTPVPLPVNHYNYVFAAQRAGMIKKVYWVPPTRKSVGEEPLDSLKEYLTGLGVDEKELASLRQDDDSITGTLNGIPVHICSLKHLPDIKGEVAAAIDLSFFRDLYQDEVKTPMLDLFGTFIDTLGGQGLAMSEVVISASTGLRRVPLDQRFLAGYLKTYFSTPGKIADGPLRTWELRAEAMYNETFFQTEEMVEKYKEAVELDPGDASLRYGLARSYFSLRDAGQMKQELDMAVKLDRGYYPAYIDFGNYFISKDMLAEGEAFSRECAAANPEDPRCWNTLYGLYIKGKAYDKAQETLAKLFGLGFTGPAYVSAQAELYSKQGMYKKAVSEYNKALDMLPATDELSRLDITLRLANMHETAGEKDKALAAYREAMPLSSDPNAKKAISERIESLKDKGGLGLIPSH